MKLTELNPRWVGAGGAGISRRGEDGKLIPVPAREGVGVSFDCPCGCDDRVYVEFKNPLDGKGPYNSSSNQVKTNQWQRVGEDFESLDLKPSIQRVQVHLVGGPVGCTWHGFVDEGELRSV